MLKNTYPLMVNGVDVGSVERLAMIHGAFLYFLLSAKNYVKDFADVSNLTDFTIFVKLTPLRLK